MVNDENLVCLLCFRNELISGSASATTAKVSLFQIEFYQQFFDIDTLEVVDRIVSSMIPKRAPATYLRTHLGVNPDLYGPFWVTITLIFTIAISGNIAQFFQHDHSSNFVWHYNFSLVSSASTCIIMYVSVMPTAIWSVLKWSVNLNDETAVDLESVCFTHCTFQIMKMILFQAPYVPTLLSIVCLYGYSLAVYVPVSVLWTIQVRSHFSVCLRNKLFVSDFIASVALSADCCISFWIGSHQRSHAIIEAVEIFILLGDWHRGSSLSSRRRVHAVFLPRSFSTSNSCSSRSRNHRPPSS